MKKIGITVLLWTAQVIGLVMSVFNIEKLVHVKLSFQNKLWATLYKRRFLRLGENTMIAGKIRLIGGQYITIGDNFYCGIRLVAEVFDRHDGEVFTPSLVIGDNVSMYNDCHIACINKIVIGNRVLIASKVFITDHFHGEVTANSLEISPAERKLSSRGPVIIEDNVWIGEGVCIMPGVKIGKNTIVGANAVVTKSFPENSVIGGIPAMVIKSLN